MSEGWAASSSSRGIPGSEWARRLEDVLEDRSALDAFKGWMSTNSSPFPLELHFAIVAYSNMCTQGNPQTNELARRIYSKYISLRTGNCTFIPSRVRQEVGTRVKSLTATKREPSLFATVTPYLEGYLRRQHDEFVHSDEFVELFNRAIDEEGSVYGDGSRTMRSNRSGESGSCRMPVLPSPAFPQAQKNSAVAPTLTAQVLMMTQREREAALGESCVERMYPSSSRHPYVCRATTSQNDSAVSSSFSASDHSGHNRPVRLSAIREEHLRANPRTFTIPRKEAVGHDGSRLYNHETEEGRRRFADVLSRKLERVVNSRRSHDVTHKQLKELREQKGMARTVISTAEAPLEVQLDDEEDVEDYLERLRVDSSGAPSTNRSPRPPHSPKPPPFPGQPSSTHHSLPPSMTASGGAGPFFNPSVHHGVNSFAPPPSLHTPSHLPPPHYSPFTPSLHGFATPRKPESGTGKEGSSMYDSSGIESLAPSDESARRRSLPGHSREDSTSRQMSTSLHYHGHHSASRERRRERRRSGSRHEMLTISYKGPDGVPVVAHVPTIQGVITLKEFRRHFSIPSSSPYHFFFKTTCAEDEESASSPYQLLLIKDDSAVLPLFNGRVTAELRPIQS